MDLRGLLLRENGGEGVKERKERKEREGGCPLPFSEVTNTQLSINNSIFWLFTQGY